MRACSIDAPINISKTYGLQRAKPRISPLSPREVCKSLFRLLETEERKKTMKRFCAVLIAGCLGAAMLSGCSGVPANTVFSADDLPGKTIGVQQGTTGDNYARDLEEKPDAGKDPARVKRYNKGADAVTALKQGKIDCVVIDNEPAKVFVAENDDLQILSDPFADEDYAIAVKKGSELTQKLNTAMRELKEDGTIDKILNNYIGDNTGTYRYISPEDTDRSNGKLVMATNADFPPYEMHDADDKIIGIDPDIFLAICDKLGYEPVIDDMAFESIIPAVRAGKADVGMAGMTVDPERLENVDFTDSYAKGVQVIITRKK